MALPDASSSWGSVEADLVEVSLDGRRCWLHRHDVAALESPVSARGVRLLPPYDMFLFQRDRAALISDVNLHKVVWRSAGNPGVVLVDGRVVGAWRPQKKGNKLRLAVVPFSQLNAAARKEIEEEAVAMAPFREANTVEVTFGDVL
jgi:Winged helix DNA-binding domain